MEQIFKILLTACKNYDIIEFYTNSVYNHTEINSCSFATYRSATITAKPQFGSPVHNLSAYALQAYFLKYAYGTLNEYQHN